jgi:hypothetical protein
VTNFVAGSGVFTWLESVSNGWTKAFYRLRGPE